MISKEKQPILSYDKFKTVRSQIRNNKEVWPGQYFKDKWTVNNSQIADYERFFSPVTTRVGDMSIVSLVKGRKAPVVVDVMSDLGATRSLLNEIADNSKFGLAVGLSDNRSEDVKSMDHGSGMEQVAGDVLRPGTWAKIQKVLGGRKVHVFMQRSYGGLGFLPRDRDILAVLMGKMWSMLSQDQGTLLIQTVSCFDPKIAYFEDHYDDAERIINNWREYLSEKGIKSVYEPCVEYRFNEDWGALKLTKSPDSPIDLPFPPDDVLDKFPLSYKEELSAQEKQAIEDTLKWCEDNS
jgi:hypothetical protein